MNSIKHLLPLLQQFGISPDQLGPDKLQRLMKITDKIEDPSRITEQDVTKILDIIGVNFNNTPRSPKKRGQKIGRNAPCPCNSGSKWKKCCGKINKNIVK